jgi:hypothetical protein
MSHLTLGTEHEGGKTTGAEVGNFGSGFMEGLDTTGDVVTGVAAGAFVGELIGDVGAFVGKLIGDLGAFVGELVGELIGETGALVGELNGVIGTSVFESSKSRSELATSVPVASGPEYNSAFMLYLPSFKSLHGV